MPLPSLPPILSLTINLINKAVLSNYIARKQDCFFLATMLVKFCVEVKSDNFVLILIITIIKSNSFHLLYLSVFQSYRVFILICGPSSYNETSYFYTELLAHINPLLNPLVYVLCSKQYRVSVKKLFTKCSCTGRCGFCGHTFYLKGKWKRDNWSFIKPVS